MPMLTDGQMHVAGPIDDDRDQRCKRCGSMLTGLPTMILPGQSFDVEPVYFDEDAFVLERTKSDPARPGGHITTYDQVDGAEAASSPYLMCGEESWPEVDDELRRDHE